MSSYTERYYMCIETIFIGDEEFKKGKIYSIEYISKIFREYRNRREDFSYSKFSLYFSMLSDYRNKKIDYILEL